MRRGRRTRRRFAEEEVNPMNYLSNLSDAMLVLAVGIMLALIVHWNVDISTSGGTMSDSGQSYAADGEGGNSAIDRDSAVNFSQDELDNMQSQDKLDSSDTGMEKLGEVYYDAATGQYYIVENGS
ncbi:MAG: DUF2149 domain-containing protein [Oscillospiraceae bacterium]|nr:DUF2149 domain-containing protein [Oscillospiraceae bacterium]